MKGFLNFLGILLIIGTVIWDVVEFLAVPALFTVIGLLNAYPPPYYVITIDAYLALFAVAELIAHFVFKAMDKKYTPLLERKLGKYFSKFSKEE